MPTAPLGKRYRKQETKVLDFVASGQLEARIHVREVHPVTPETPSTRPLRLLKRGEKLDNGRICKGKVRPLASLPAPSNMCRRSEGSERTCESGVKHNEVTFLLLDDIDSKLLGPCGVTVMSPQIMPQQIAKSAPYRGSSNIDIEPYIDLMIMVSDVGVQTE